MHIEYIYIYTDGDGYPRPRSSLGLPKVGHLYPHEFNSLFFLSLSSLFLFSLISNLGCLYRICYFIFFQNKKTKKKKRWKSGGQVDEDEAEERIEKTCFITSSSSSSSYGRIHFLRIYFKLECFFLKSIKLLYEKNIIVLLVYRSLYFL